MDSNHPLHFSDGPRPECKVATVQGLSPSFKFFLRSNVRFVDMKRMPRRLRLQYPDASYHLMTRGNGRQNIVCDDVDRDRLQSLRAW